MIRKSLKGGTFSTVVTTSDEAFVLFIMRDYDKIPTEEGRKKTNWLERDWRMWWQFWWDYAINQTNEVWTLWMDTLLGWWYTWLHFKIYAYKKGQQDDDESTIESSKVGHELIFLIWWLVWSQKHSSVTNTLFVMLALSRLAVWFTFSQNKILSCLHLTLSVEVGFFVIIGNICYI